VLHQEHSERKQTGFICKVSSIKNAKTQRPINRITWHSKTLQHSLYKDITEQFISFSALFYFRSVSHTLHLKGIAV